MEFLQRHFFLVTAELRRWYRATCQWQARIRHNWSTPGPEPGYFIFLPTIILVMLLLIWMLGRMAQLAAPDPDRIHAPAGGPQIIANIIGFAIVFGVPVILILTIGAAICAAAYEADHNRHQRRVDTAQAKLKAEQEAATRRYWQQAEAQRVRRQEAEAAAEAQRQAAEMHRQIAQQEERVRKLLAEHAAAERKLREAKP